MAIGGKPFSLQAPEQIAKEYGGDKQKIIQAARMGVVDPTAAVLAGMFIDRIRTAQTAEQGAPTTVAQDVFTPPAPPPMQAPQGIGAPPMQAAPDMGAPPAGIEALPVSEGMFPDEQPGMAGGGIVAFSRGGTSYSDVVDWLYPLIEQQESGGRPRPGQPTRYGTAQGVAQMLPSTARGVARDLGVPYNEALLMGTDAESIAYQRALGREYTRQGLEWGGGDPQQAAMFYHGGPDRSIHGPRTRAYAQQVLGRRGDSAGGDSGGGEAAPITGTPPLSLEEFRQMVTPKNQRGLEGNVEMFQQLFDQHLPDTSAIEETIADLRDRNTPEEAKAQREQDLWGALADFGFKWAASGNIAKSAGETFTGLRETLDSRREEELDNLTRIIQLEGLQIERAMPAIEAGAAAYNNEQEATAAAGSQLANYATQMGTTQAGIAGRIQEALLTPDTSGAMTTSQATQLGQKVIEDFGILDSGITEDTQSIPQAIKDLHAAVRSGQLDEATAFRQGAQYYFGAFTGAGTGAGAPPANAASRFVSAASGSNAAPSMAPSNPLLAAARGGGAGRVVSAVPIPQ